MKYSLLFFVGFTLGFPQNVPLYQARPLSPDQLRTDAADKCGLKLGENNCFHQFASSSPVFGPPLESYSFCVQKWLGSCSAKGFYKLSSDEKGQMEKVNGDYYIKCDPQFVPKGTKCITETCWRGYKLSHDGSMCEPDCENPEKNRLCGMPNMGYGAQYDRNIHH